MKQATQKFPPGWTEKRVRALVAYYGKQTDEEGATEIETAPEATGATWMSVPNELVPAIAQLIEDHEHKAMNGRPRTRRTKPRSQRNTR